MTTAGTEEVGEKLEAEAEGGAEATVAVAVAADIPDVPEAIDGSAASDAETLPEVEEEVELEQATTPAQAEDGILELAEAATADGESDPEEDSISEVEIRATLEALLFAAAEPIPLQRLSRLFQGQGRGIVKKALAGLQEGLANDGRGIRLVEVSSGYQFRSAPEHALWLRRFFAEKPPRLSRALLETVSIIAYRQPVTRGEIEAIRGVNCDAILTALQNRDLIVATGRRDTPGRPVEYGTTSEFLELFTMRDLSELPPLPDAESLANLLKEEAVFEETEISPDTEEHQADLVVEGAPEESLPDGGLAQGAGAENASDAAELSDQENVASPEAIADGETSGVKAMAAAAGVGGTGEEPSVIDQASESGQADGTNSEDSQPGGSRFPSGGRGTDS
jgi:segregation and condensation protein B